MWKSACVGVWQLLKWKMHGKTLKNIEAVCIQYKCLCNYALCWAFSFSMLETLHAQLLNIFDVSTVSTFLKTWRRYRFLTFLLSRVNFFGKFSQLYTTNFINNNTHSRYVLSDLHRRHRAWGGVVVKALRYKSKIHGIDSRCRPGFFPSHVTVPCTLGSTQTLKMSTRIILVVKAAGA